MSRQLSKAGPPMVPLKTMLFMRTADEWLLDYLLWTLEGKALCIDTPRRGRSLFSISSVLGQRTSGEPISSVSCPSCSFTGVIALRSSII